MAYKKKPVGKVNNPDDLMKKQAYGVAMFGTTEEYKDQDPNTSVIFGDGFDEIVAPSKTPAGQPPRAHYCGYHAGAELLVIIFRGPGRTVKGVWTEDAGKPQPWIMYTNVDQSSWESLKGARSTGDWLRDEIGGYGWSDVPGNNKTGLAKVVESILAS